MNNPALDHPIMIGGCGSSGTTLLAHCLDSHPELYCGPELYLLNKRQLYSRSFNYTTEEFRNLIRRGVPTTDVFHSEFVPPSTLSSPRRTTAFIRNCENHRVTEEEVCRIAFESVDFPSFVSCLASKILHRNEKERWAEKTPQNCYCIKEFLEAFPGGFYVHVVRDGRDVVPSLVKRGMPVEQAVRRWMHDTAAILPYLQHEQCYILRYEDLVDQPENELGSLLEFLGASGQVSAMLRSAFSSPVREETHGSWNSQPSQGFKISSKEKWKKEDYHDHEYIQQLFKHLLMSEQVTRILGVPDSFCGNDLLSVLDYEASSFWEVNPPRGLRFYLHVLKEKFHGLVGSDKSELHFKYSLV